MQMKLEDIYQFFQNPPPTYLCQELAVCYILSVLLGGESYGTELMQRLSIEYPPYRLSDTILDSALDFLEAENALVGYSKKVTGRGRPRRMYMVASDWLIPAAELATFWHEYTKLTIKSNH